MFFEGLFEEYNWNSSIQDKNCRESDYRVQFEIVHDVNDVRYNNTSYLYSPINNCKAGVSDLNLQNLTFEKNKKAIYKDGRYPCQNNQNNLDHRVLFYIVYKK